MATPFLDTNILLRHLLQDHPQQSAGATRLLARIENGDLKARISEFVIFETVFTLQRQYGHAKTAIRDNFLPLIELPSIVLPRKRHFRQVFDLYVDLNISFVDAYHAVLMKQLKIEEIFSFDREFDRIPGVMRLEPEA